MAPEGQANLSILCKSRMIWGHTVNGVVILETSAIIAKTMAGLGGTHLLPTPKKFTVMAGTAEGPTRLNAFDNALLAAGIGNLNLLRVSSILPPHAEEKDTFQMAPGSLLPTAYGTITSEEPGALISAAVAVGIGRPDEYGVIMEFSGHCSREEAAATVEKMARQAFEQRGRELERVVVRAVEHRVESIGCAFAAVALWY